MKTFIGEKFGSTVRGSLEIKNRAQTAIKDILSLINPNERRLQIEDPYFKDPEKIRSVEEIEEFLKYYLIETEDIEAEVLTNYSLIAGYLSYLELSKKFFRSESFEDFLKYLESLARITPLFGKLAFQLKEHSLAYFEQYPEQKKDKENYQYIIKLVSILFFKKYLMVEMLKPTP
jgi:hypothetical protein